MKSQNAKYGIFVVVVVDSPKNKNAQLKKLQALEDERDKTNLSIPEIIFVDACERQTACKTK